MIVVHPNHITVPELTQHYASECCVGLLVGLELCKGM